MPDLATELAKCDFASLGNASVATSTAASEKGDDSDDDDGEENDLELEELRRKVKTLAVRPVEGGDGQQTQDVWESELNATVNKLDRLMMLRENAMHTNNPTSLPASPAKQQLQPHHHHRPAISNSPVKMLKKSEPLASANSSMKELPLLARISNEISERAQKFQIRRRLSLE